MRGTATDMMKSVFDVTGETFAGSSATLGKMISEIETQLYYDGIQHTTKRSGANRMHYFTKRQDTDLTDKGIYSMTATRNNLKSVSVFGNSVNSCHRAKKL